MTSQKNPEKSISDQLSELLAQLSTDQIRFIVARQEFPSDKEAAESVGIKPDTVYRWPDIVKDTVKLMAADGLLTAAEVLKRSVAKAALVKAAGLDTNDDRLRQAVASDILDRVMGKAKQTIETTGKDGEPLTIRFVNDWRSPENIQDGD